MPSAAGANPNSCDGDQQNDALSLKGKFVNQANDEADSSNEEAEENQIEEEDEGEEQYDGESASGDDESEHEVESSSSTSDAEDVDDDEEEIDRQATETDSKGPAKPAASFFIDFGDGGGFERNSVGLTSAGGSRTALQKSFQTYLRRKKKDLKQECKAQRLQLNRSMDPDRMWSLRMKFLDKCRSYFGVPYKRKYWTEEDPEYNSPLFLDCCGLIRRVMYDLRKDFGFRIGPWNQAYMFDTLPLKLTEETMQPGDLVFIEAVYYSETAKKQKHNMVHVEVWLGDGPKTIGARWQKGKVQVFDSYKFVSTSYHSQVHHFCSIDTWLRGICRSFCPEHPWKRQSSNSSAGRANKYSIFANNNKSQQQQQQQQGQGKKSRRKKKKKTRRVKCGKESDTSAAAPASQNLRPMKGRKMCKKRCRMPEENSQKQQTEIKQNCSAGEVFQKCEA